MFQNSIKKLARSIDSFRQSERQVTTGRALVPFSFRQPQRAKPSEANLITFGYDKSPSTYVNSAAEEIFAGS